MVRDLILIVYGAALLALGALFMSLAVHLNRVARLVVLLSGSARSGLCRDERRDERRGGVGQ